MAKSKTQKPLPKKTLVSDTAFDALVDSVTNDVLRRLEPHMNGYSAHFVGLEVGARQQALDLAVATSPKTAKAETILERAEKFAAFTLDHSLPTTAL